MRKFLLVLALACLVFTSTAHAQETLRLALVSVDIWPEYDQPAVLVVYRIGLAADTSLPASLTLRIPARAQVHVVATLHPVYGLLNTPYERLVQDDWALLTLRTDSLQVRVEYYDALDKNDTQRRIVFLWPGDYAADALEVNFLHPVGAEKVKINPAPASTAPGQDGLPSSVVQAEGLAAGRTFRLTIEYQRQRSDLSISSLPVQAVATPGIDTPGRVSITGILPWLLGGLGILLVMTGMAGLVVWRAGSRAEKRLRRARPPREVVTEDIYCHQCGRRAQPGDVFCRTCGSRLRRGAAD